MFNFPVSDKAAFVFRARGGKMRGVNAQQEVGCQEWPESVRFGWFGRTPVCILDRVAAARPSPRPQQKCPGISASLLLPTNPIKSVLYSVGTTATERDGKRDKFDKKVPTRIQLDAAARLMERLSPKIFIPIDAGAK